MVPSMFGKSRAGAQVHVRRPCGLWHSHGVALMWLSPQIHHSATRVAPCTHEVTCQLQIWPVKPKKRLHSASAAPLARCTNGHGDDSSERWKRSGSARWLSATLRPRGEQVGAIRRPCQSVAWHPHHQHKRVWLRTPVACSLRSSHTRWATDWHSALTWRTTAGFASRLVRVFR